MHDPDYIRGFLYEQIVAFLQAHHRDKTEARKQAAAEQVLRITCAENRWEADAYEVLVRHVPGKSLIGLNLGPPYRVFVKHRDAVTRLADLGM